MKMIEEGKREIIFNGNLTEDGRLKTQTLLLQERTVEMIYIGHLNEITVHIGGAIWLMPG